MNVKLVFHVSLKVIYRFHLVKSPFNLIFSLTCYLEPTLMCYNMI